MTTDGHAASGSGPVIPPGAKAYAMTLLDVCAELVRKPFSLSMDQIMRLDRWTIQHVYFAPRDKEGRLYRRPRTHRTAWERWGPRPRYTGQLGEWVTWAISQGWPEWYAVARWAGEQDVRRAWKEYWKAEGRAAQAAKTAKRRQAGGGDA